MPETQSEQLTKFYNNTKINFKIFNFTNKIIDYYSKVNLVITRSGASALGELINVKIPFISFPYHHQLIIINIKTLSFMQKKVMDIYWKKKILKLNCSI